MRNIDLPDFPICLYSTGNVAVGSVYTPDADDMQNDFQRMIQIEEIRIMLFVNGFWSGGVGGIMGSLSASIRMQLKMGRMDMTNGFVPVWLLGARMQQSVEQGNGVISGARGSVWEYQRWKLPVPIIVPNGATLLPMFQYLTPTGKTVVAHANDSPITVHIALVGRSLNGAYPSRVKVPYASAWIGRSFAAAGGVTQQSNDDQLVNKFNALLHVQRFTGRIAGSIDGTDGDLWQDVTGGGLTGATSTPSGAIGGGVGPIISIKDSAGYSVVNSPMPIGGPFWDHVFDPARKAFTTNRILEPRGWYVATVQSGPGAGHAVPMIGMIGWREEEIAP